MIRKIKKADIKGNFKIYLGFLKKYKWLFFLLVFIVLLKEAKQIVDKFLFKIAIDRSTEFLAGTLANSVLIKILLALALTYIILAVLTAFLDWVRINFLNLLDSKMMFDLKQKYFNHLIGLDHKFYSSHKTGSLISRLTRGSGAMERINDSIIFEFAPLILQLAVLLGSLIYLDINSAIILAITFCIFLTYSLIMQKKIDNRNLIFNQAEDIEKGNIADIFTNIDSIKYFGKEKFIKNKYNKLSTNTIEKLMKAWDLWRVISFGQTLILGLGTITLLYFSFKGFLAGTLTIGTLTFIYTTYISILGPLFSFVHGFRNLSRAMTDFQDLFEYGKAQSSIKDKPLAEEMEVKEGEVLFDNVTFSYENRKIFKDFTLKIPRNKKVAFVGHSGSGKTTLVKLLYRLYDVNKGSIKIDGKDIRDFKHESLRSEMAIVPQECVLFDDTVYNNIAFSNPKASRKEVMEAIRFAQLDRIIEKFPNKENTIVGERGIKLSGGEKQRVSIARAILANKRILVLDEATSSLDSETEHEIQKDLARLMENRTSIVIAHRLSTIMHADLIVVLKDGKIVQTGKHYQLINQLGEYKKLWNLQKGGYLKE
ncbi:ABC transporter ATP-binding protein [Candidatus Pacearchaeota archaeon]|nr:ABC transporter ATP-binding protein [Candidatus Pacearchaeota archaeon]